MRFYPVFFCKTFLELLFHLIGIIGVRKADAVRDALYMRINGNRRDAESECKNNIRGLSADAGKRRKLLHCMRHLAAKILDKPAGSSCQTFRLISK